jgi:hypothetical protein
VQHVQDEADESMHGVFSLCVSSALMDSRIQTCSWGAKRSRQWVQLVRRMVKRDVGVAWRSACDANSGNTAGRQLLHSIFMDKFTSRTQRRKLVTPVLPSKKKMVYDDRGRSISSEARGHKLRAARLQRQRMQATAHTATHAGDGNRREPEGGG